MSNSSPDIRERAFDIIAGVLYTFQPKSVMKALDEATDIRRALDQAGIIFSDATDNEAALRREMEALRTSLTEAIWLMKQKGITDAASPE
jgi:hypothetical protein